MAATTGTSGMHGRIRDNTSCNASSMILAKRLLPSYSLPPLRAALRAAPRFAAQTPHHSLRGSQRRRRAHRQPRKKRPHRRERSRGWQGSRAMSSHVRAAAASVVSATLARARRDSETPGCFLPVPWRRRRGHHETRRPCPAFLIP